MEKMETPGIGLLGLGSYLPERVVTNRELEGMVDTSDEWILARTGIRERRIAAPGEQTSDLAVQASQRALEDAGLRPSDIDGILLATITPDHPFPATANLVQTKLGVPKAFAFDLSAACSGFVYGLSAASGYIASGMARRVLVVAADKLSTVVDWRDRSTCVLFGDGAAAAVVGPAAGKRKLSRFVLGADGSGFDDLYVPAGGTAAPASAATLEAGGHFLKMKGRPVFQFGVEKLCGLAGEVGRLAGMAPEDFDWIVPHQANIRILRAAAERMSVPMERFAVTVDRFGNISGASLPVALEQTYREGRLKEGQRILLAGFGAGLSWAGALLEW